jgi:hypothetical protein
LSALFLLLGVVVWWKKRAALQDKRKNLVQQTNNEIDGYAVQQVPTAPVEMPAEMQAGGPPMYTKK